jgi:hypothetical protein
VIALLTLAPAKATSSDWVSTASLFPSPRLSFASPTPSRACLCATLATAGTRLVRAPPHAAANQRWCVARRPLGLSHPSTQLQQRPAGIVQSGRSAGRGGGVVVVACFIPWAATGRLTSHRASNSTANPSPAGCLPSALASDYSSYPTSLARAAPSRARNLDCIQYIPPGLTRFSSRWNHTRNTTLNNRHLIHTRNHNRHTRVPSCRLNSNPITRINKDSNRWLANI